ncbi:hypothetical protein [Bailinhaonella thermotolerans]|uniref:Uncharacterized protein n=1 Tax=Bailinhaonella thermotolerans TaxID=1070861 RepID=A0A3A4B273_9ACTN|nr:hypothetical protein [Bailinhaonella thermotolerans]RJL32107.1 hypothetical protein D5H75_16955 [Bailinhaonella thermotolerans]
MGGDERVVVPFRWDPADERVVREVTAGEPEPELWYLPELVRCAGEVLAASEGGETWFLGRSADSLFDLLTGALAGTSAEGLARHLTISLEGEPTPEEVRRLRGYLGAVGLTPYRIRGLGRPVVFADLVDKGETFAILRRVLCDWAGAELDLRFLGIAMRARPDAGWTAKLPPGTAAEIVMDDRLWEYLAYEQEKLTPSFHRRRWAETWLAEPRRDRYTRQALAEASALVRAGRTAEVRTALANALTRGDRRSELASELTRIPR